MQKSLLLSLVMVLTSFFSISFAQNIDNESLVATQVMLDNGISTVGSQADLLYQPLSRREASLLFVRFAKKFYDQGVDESANCSFGDLVISASIKQEIIESCQRGLFKGKFSLFKPFDTLTRGQLVIVLARMLSNDSSMELTAAYNYLLSNGIIRKDDRDTQSRPALRNELYIMLARLIDKSMPSDTPSTTNNKFTQQILQLVSYQEDPFTQDYKPVGLGSAVLIADNIILTNAHVVLDDYDNPTGLYEICQTNTVHEDPDCFTHAQLQYYDAEQDLALLTLSQKITNTKPVQLASANPKAGSEVTIYGYPADGGSTITTAKGIIAGYEYGMAKIDAIVDHGNSGGGGFDKQGKLIGIPTAKGSEFGFMIPIENILAFISKDGEIIEYDQNTPSAFQDYIDRSQEQDSIDNAYFAVQDVSPYEVQGALANKDHSRLFMYVEDSNDQNTTRGLHAADVFGTLDAQSVLASYTAAFEGSSDYKVTTTTIQSANQVSGHQIHVAGAAFNKGYNAYYYFFPAPGFLLKGFIASQDGKKADLTAAQDIFTKLEVFTGAGVKKTNYQYGPVSIQVADPFFIIDCRRCAQNIYVQGHPSIEGTLSISQQYDNDDAYRSIQEYGEQDLEFYVDEYDEQELSSGLFKTKNGKDIYIYSSQDTELEEKYVRAYTRVQDPQYDDMIDLIEITFTIAQDDNFPLSQIIDFIKSAQVN